jgi:hypothetical protein|nr:MAG TPA: hypothetical protein [Caudoviricetes sp.]
MPFDDVTSKVGRLFFCTFYLNCVPNQIRIHNNNSRLIIIINSMISLNLKLYKEKALAVIANASFIF